MSDSAFSASYAPAGASARVVDPARDTVTVIIPAKNAARVIGRAIQSVLNQTVPPHEVIVIDDDSTDDTAAIAQAFPGVSTYRVKYSNRARARNFGVARASGKWLAFLDSDDEWHPTKLEKQLACMRAHNLQLGFHDFALQDDTGGLVASWAGQFLKDQATGSFIACGLRDIVGGNDFLFTMTAIIDREAWFEVGGMRREFVRCQDIDTWLRVYESGARIGFLHEVLGTKHAHRDIPKPTTYWYKLQLIRAARDRAMLDQAKASDLAHLDRTYLVMVRSFAGWARRHRQHGLCGRLYLTYLIEWVRTRIDRTLIASIRRANT